MFRPLSVSIAALTSGACLCAPVMAQTFEEEARAAISSSPVLASERARVRAVRQALPLAWSELLPQVTADAAAIERDSSESSFAFTVREQDEYWIASVRVSTMLFGSGRVQGTTRQARAQIASAVAQYQSAMQDFTVEFTQAYAEVRFSLENLAAQEQSLANLEEQARYARANLREGFLTRTDVAQAEARVALAHADLARARARVVEANEFFLRLAGRPPGVLAPAGRMAGLPIDLESAYAIAEDNHPALAAAAANVQAAEAAVDVAASNGRVRVFLESTNSTFDAISRNDFSQEFESSVSVRATVPLFTGGATSARTRQQRYAREASRYDLIDVQRRVREQVAVNWSRLEAARARLDASRAGLEAAEFASRGVRREQQYGQRSIIDVLNQEQERLNAQVALAEAERDVTIAERALASSVGYLPQMLGVSVSPER